MARASRPLWHLPSSFATDVLTTISGNLKRFVSIFVICLLGSCMLVGLKAACDDLRLTADAYFDQQGLYDISVQSTLGLSSKDIDALVALDGVEDAEGGYAETAFTQVGGAPEKVNLRIAADKDMNRPLLIEGELPTRAGEVAVTKGFLQASGFKAGDEVAFSPAATESPVDENEVAPQATASVSAEDDDGASTAEVFRSGSYKIVGVVRDPMDVNADGQTMTFRTGSSVKYSFFLSRDAVIDPDTYTVAYIAVNGAAPLRSYSDAYQKKIDEVKRQVEGIRDERQKARADELRRAGQDALDKQASELQQGISYGAVSAQQAAEARAQMDAARAQLDQIGPATWYIQDRTALASYTSVDSDASSIEAIATVFPVIFFAVAILISLTTATRMVEEDRGIIGLYKAMGYRDGKIMSKYLIYTFAASASGSLAGELLGFIVLPEILFIIFETMYSLPAFQLHLNLPYAFAAFGLFTVGIVGATALSCRHVLRERPAELMRPRAPRAGSRILLERISPLWRHMGFLNKVAARNLLRYKKRFFMTVLGIAGCTALMICGLGIRDTVISLNPRQYGGAGITRYDLMAVSADADFAAARDLLKASSEVASLQEARIDGMTAEFGGARESVQVVVVPDGTDLSPYVRLADENGRDLSLPQGDQASMLITKNAEQVLGFKVGDEVTLQDSSMNQGAVRVEGIALNYLGNLAYMTESAYRQAFGHDVARNAFLADLKGDAQAQEDFADKLGENDLFASITSTARVSGQFAESFKIVDIVVYVVTVMAAALAFAVVFTLSTTNISERVRELATIKVLGFRRREVHRYINKETMVLAVIGIAAGCPLGYALVRFLGWALRMPSLFFDTLVDPASYAVAGAASLVFVLVVNMITNRSLDRVDMVGALKSTE